MTPLRRGFATLLVALSASAGGARAEVYDPQIDDTKAICAAFFVAVAGSGTVDDKTAQELTEIASVLAAPRPTLSAYMKQELTNLRRGLEIQFRSSFVTDPDDRYSGREELRETCVDFARARPETRGLVPD